MKKVKNRRKTTIARIVLSLLALTTSLLSSARDFEYTYEGQTLTYTVLDEDAKTVTTKKFQKISGDLILPEHPKEGDVEYTLTEICESAFFDCSSLTSITIPNSVTVIGIHAFYWCSSLVSITIPNSVIEIGDAAFYGCRHLDNINVDSSNMVYSSLDGVLFNKDQTVLITCPNARTEYIIPNSVTEIGNYALYGCSFLTSVTIPNSVTVIGESVFENCTSLTSIEIPNSVTCIDIFAFSGCTSLASVTIPNSVTVIEACAFCNCSSLTSITIPNSVTEIGEEAFSKCSNLKTVTCLSEEPPILGRSCFKEGRELLYIPDGALSKYQASSWINYFMDIKELQDSIKFEISSTDSDAHISVSNSTVTISGLDTNEPVSVFDIKGKVIYKGFEHQLTLKSGNIYILTTPTNTYKIAL